MGSRSPKQARRGKAAAPAVVLPKPSITLDIVMLKPDGSPDQRRPSFTDFYDAIDALQAYQREWDNKMLPALKRAAKKKV